MLLTTLGAIALLLAISAFFSGSETALTAVSRGRMHQLEKDGSRAARNVNRLVADREKLIGALLLGNTFINILASSLATQLLETRVGPRAVAVTTAVMTVSGTAERTHSFRVTERLRGTRLPHGRASPRAR